MTKFYHTYYVFGYRNNARSNRVHAQFQAASVREVEEMTQEIAESLNVDHAIAINVLYATAAESKKIDAFLNGGK